jgi:hypothetical protein
MTFGQFAVAVHDCISIEAALVMVRMGLGPGMRPVGVRGCAPRCENVHVETAALERQSPSPRESRKAKSGTGQELRGRPSMRAQALVREQLANGPKRGEDVQATAEAADISERALIAAGCSLGVRTRKEQWWIPGRV